MCSPCTGTLAWLRGQTSGCSRTCDDWGTAARGLITRAPRRSRSAAHTALAIHAAACAEERARCATASSFARRSRSEARFTAPSPVDACADPPLPSFHPDHAWIEVLRIATIAVSGSAAAVARFGEGGGHGCWFLALNGTGVFLHLGRSIRAQSRAALGAALGINLTKLTSTPGRPLWHSPWSEISRRCIRTCGSAMARGGEASISFDSIQLVEESCRAEASIASSWWRSHAAPARLR
jgi:hypothetical protein